MKSGKQGVIKRRGRRKDFTQKAFEPSPEFFNRVEFRGVGGRNRRLQPAFWATEISRLLEWNEALSITMTVPLLREGKSWLENQDSKRPESIVPLYSNGARI